MRKSYNDDINADKGLAAGMEAKRLAEKYNKDFLDCNDLILILGVGKNNVRDLMKSQEFPTISIGSRKIVSIIGFAMWLLKREEQ